MMDWGLFFQALIIGILCYLGAVETPWMYGVVGGYYILGRPLVAGLLIGLVFGDVKAGVLCGLAVQAVFIATMHTGGTSSTEITYAAYGGIGLAMATTRDPAIAVTLALFIGQTFGLLFYNLRMAGFSYYNHKAEKAARELDKRGLILNQIVYPQIVTFLVRVVPVFLAIYLGRGAVQTLLNSVPTVITNIISVLGGVLPALGIAMLMSILIKNKVELIFFFFGFVMIAFAKLNTVALVFIAALIAYLVFLVSAKENGNGKQAKPVSATVDNDEEYEDPDLF
ncbi:PTS sugar transporter IIC component [Lacticaseibacillus paracasei]|nr:PTS system mannose-specific EIIC component [Lacticaseibacillus paracasei]GAV18891.1 PTS sugar transporter IIC component [Lacticaseibacillus paracasei]